MLNELWKAKGTQARISNYRDVTFCEPDAKVLSVHKRSAALSTIQNLVLPTAMGSGFNTGACDTAHLLLTEQLAHAMHKNVSAFVLYADIQCAFASLHRNIALRDPNSDDVEWKQHLMDHGFSKEEANDIVSIAITCLQWEVSGGAQHAFLRILEAHRNTWCTTEGLAMAVRFTRGSAAGTSLADLIFILGMTAVLSKIECRIVAEGLQSYMFAGGTAEYF